MNRFIILAVALAALVALPFVVTTRALAQSGSDEPTTAAVDVTVWRSVSDPSLLYVSTRPEGGRWRTLNTALDMSALSSSGNFQQSNAVRVAVPLTGGGTANVDVTVWRRVSDPSLLYVSTRPEGGRWRTLNTALDMSALSSSGNFHQSNAVRVKVPLGESGSDRAALVALYHSTEGASWTTSTNWLSGRPLDEWHGVTTNSDGRVTELLLWGNQLTGSIPAELGDLTNLETLWLEENRLTGSIPAELGDLTNLETLVLWENQLTGSIPAELGDLTNLDWLVLANNRLTGSIPAELGDLTNLVELYLSGNRLTGPIPAELGDLTNLETLWLSGNRLTGCVPVGLRDVAEDNDLGELGLPDCGFEGRATAIRVGADVRGALDYDGDIDYFRFTSKEGQLYQIDVALGTLDDSVLTLMGPDSREVAYNDDHGDSLASRLSWEASSSDYYYIAVEGYGTGTYTLTVSIADPIDDHANSERRATAIRVGAGVQGAVDSQDDIDYFRFTALRAQIYQIDVDLGTLDRSYIYLFDTDGSFLGNEMDDGGPFASGLYWKAPSSGEHYVAVEGVFGIGSYTLTVSLADPIDDHGNSGGRATEITVVGEDGVDGVDVRGALDSDGDIDYFRFWTDGERSYEINVALGTLDDSIVSLYGGDGSLLDSNDDHGDSLASRLFWEAPRNGYYYVAVEGYDTGTYTLTVAIVDDHGDDLRSATRIAVGEYVRIVLHDYDDRDVLVFRARRGTEYVFALDFQTGGTMGAAAGTTMALHEAGGLMLARLRDYDFSSNGRNEIMWRAATGGDYYIVVGNEDAFGVFALTVTVR